MIADTSYEFLRELNAEQGIQEMPKYSKNKTAEEFTTIQLAQVIAERFNLPAEEVYKVIWEYFCHDRIE